MKLGRYLFLAALTALTSFAATPSAQAIVGPARDGSAYRDRIVMILNRGAEGSGFCTGVVMSPRVLLTAAHCLRAPKDMLVVYRDDTGRPVTFRVSRSQRHPAYRADAIQRRVRSVDLGLVEIETPLPNSFNATPLATRTAEVGESVEIAGFGVALERQPKTGGVPRAATLRVSDPLSKIVLWAKDPGDQGLGACAGDSGSPVFASDGSVLAIVAWTKGAGARDCGILTQGLYVAPETPWLSTTITEWSQ